METIKEPKQLDKLAKAVIKVIKSVKGIDKDMTVGSGNYAYKGVSDKEVKSMFNKLMQENGLCMLPIEVEPVIQISRWQEPNGNYPPKQKQSVFTEVKTKYLLLHESGQNITLAGYGQGVDAGDKGAGKATTYAMKYALLYSFMVATGKIDDSDNQHSNEQQVPQQSQQKKPKNQPIKKKKLSEETYKQAIKSENKKALTDALTHYDLTPEQLKGITGRLEELNSK